MPAGIQFDKLSFSYHRDQPVLKDISLEIKPGEKFGIIGPSGSGKSTLMLHLNGILKGEGRVSIGGLQINKKNLGEIRRKVGLVFQNPDDQLFNPTVEEDIAFGPLNFGFSAETTQKRMEAVLSALKLSGFEKLTSHHLSFGERKRVALATVLVLQPEVIAFDEPFSNLDPEMVLQLMKMMNSLDTTLVIVSQSVLPLISVCDRLAVLKEGRIIAVDKPKNIIRNKEMMRSSGLDIDFYCDICRDLHQGQH